MILWTGKSFTVAGETYNQDSYSDVDDAQTQEGDRGELSHCPNPYELP
jgi:hypothetical protein